jgi:hypothetical protein
VKFASTPTGGTLLLAGNYVTFTDSGSNVSITDIGSGILNYKNDGSGGTLINC